MKKYTSNTDEKDITVRVSAGSRSEKVAGAIAGLIRDGKNVDVRAIGSEAISQAVKAITLATSFLAEDSVRLYTHLNFMPVQERSNTNTLLVGVVFNLVTYGRYAARPVEEVQQEPWQVVLSNLDSDVKTCIHGYRLAECLVCFDQEE